MKQQTTTQNEYPINFSKLIDLLREKVTAEITMHETKKTSQETKVAFNDLLYKSLGYINIIPLIATIGLVLGLFVSTGFLIFKSYNIFHTLSLAVNERQISSVLLFLSGGASFGLGIASLYNFNPILDGLCHFFDIAIIRPFEKMLTRSKAKGLQKIKSHGSNLSYLRETLKSLKTMQDNFQYLIPSSLKDKTVTIVTE